MKYLHYIHIGKNWFYWFSEYDSKKIYRPYEGDGSINKNFVRFAGNNVTKSKAKKLLLDKFPEHKPILTYPYHQGTKLKKYGSRPIKYVPRNVWYKDEKHQ